MKPKRKKENQFKKKKMNNKEVIDYLFEICHNNLCLKPGSEPGDLNSTNALDSLLSVICSVVKDNT